MKETKQIQKRTRRRENGMRAYLKRSMPGGFKSPMSWTAGI
ncbi:hypothetical protein [Tichowtungia aerotolerans]|nr:hypothetical protein [Tichowtungia aerotolerans]